MRPLGLIIPVLLAACASAQQSCIDTVTRDLNVVRSLIADTEATIERGYAIQTEQRLVSYSTFCVGAHGKVGVTFCDRVQPVTSNTPIAVDLDVERRKLASLKRKEVELDQKAVAMIAQCKAQHPET